MGTERSTKRAAKSEKKWLVFAVRKLSRVVVGKVKGKEKIWNIIYKAEWWDEEVKSITNSCDVRLTWKNPTTNPKDRKCDLIIKFKILSKRLRAENKFPKDLEEEAELWESGRINELLLLKRGVSIKSKTHSTPCEINHMYDNCNGDLLKHPRIVNTSDRCDLNENIEKHTTARSNSVKETTEPEPGDPNTFPQMSSSTCNLISKRKSFSSEHLICKRCRLDSPQKCMNFSSNDNNENGSLDLLNSFASLNTHLNASTESNIDLVETSQRDCTSIQIENISNPSFQENTTCIDAPIPALDSPTRICQTFAQQSSISSDSPVSSPLSSQSPADCFEVPDTLFLSIIQSYNFEGLDRFMRIMDDKSQHYFETDTDLMKYLDPDFRETN